MVYKAKDFARSTLAGSLNTVVTSLTVQTGHGDRFPVLAAPDYTTLVIKDGAGNFEKVKAEIRASGADTISTLTRGYDGTTARSWSIGAIVEHCPDATIIEQAAKDRAQHEAAADPHPVYALKTTPDFTGTLALSGDISPAQITASQNDYAPAGLSAASTLRLDLSAAWFITGLTGGVDGRIIAIHNLSAFMLTLLGESASSAAANRFATEVQVPGKRGVILQYDATSSRWRLLGTVLTPADLQAQTYTAFTTGGTGTAFTLTPTPALTANAAKVRYNPTLHADPSGSPTLAVSGLAALNFKYYDPTGTKQFVTTAQAKSGMSIDIVNDGTDWVLLDPLVPAATSKIQPISGSVAANALTLTLNPTTLDFRSPVMAGAVVNTRTISSPISLVVPNTATLGTVSGQPGRLILIAMDYVGVIELAVANIAYAGSLDEAGLISTTAIAGGSNTFGIYSTTARSNLPYRIVGFVESTQATAGTWATAPSTIQGIGGQALAALSSLGYGQSWQAVTRTSGTTYYNTTRKPITVKVEVSQASASLVPIVTVTINGASIGVIAQSVNSGGASYSAGTTIIPAGASYVLTDTNVTSRTTYELR